MELRAAPIEYVLIAVALLGVVFNLRLLRTAYAAQRVLRFDETTTESEHIVADATILHESFRTGKQVLILFGGCVSTLLPPPPPDARDVPQTVVTLSVMIAVSIWMTVTSIFEQRAQRDVARATARAALKVKTVAAEVSDKVEQARQSLDKSITENTQAAAKSINHKVDTVVERMGETVTKHAEILQRAVAEAAAASKEAAHVANDMNAKFKELRLDQNRLQRQTDVIEDEQKR